MTQITSVSFEEELEKNPQLKESDIENLRNWCKKQLHLPKISDSELALFLHSNYYRMEPTKTTIDSYYTIRTHVPEYFTDRNPFNKDLRVGFQVTCMLPLKQITKEGYSILFVSLIDYDPSKYVTIHNVKILFMQLDMWLYISGTTKGHVLLFNVQHICMGHIARLSPMAVKTILCYLQDALPVRLKGLHFMNTSPVMDILLGMMKPFMKKELMNITYLHSTLESVNKFLPVEGLPNEIGGKAGPIIELQKAEIQKLEYHLDWFLEEESRARVDESKRPTNAKSSIQFSGVEGSFKKLDID